MSVINVPMKGLLGKSHVGSRSNDVRQIDLEDVGAVLEEDIDKLLNELPRALRASESSDDSSMKKGTS
ncbi:MAG: hypothetical protein AAFQ63_15580 [Cyanobacteria bacterium J06621_11]